MRHRWLPARILESLGLRANARVEDADSTSVDPTGGEVRRPSGRWREYAATSSR